jgi:glycosyltransferase involved in cell wall biosynthesis
MGPRKSTTGRGAGPAGRVRSFLVCTGLGHVCRGYETFTRECFDALRGDDRLDLHLFKGAGPAGDRERPVPCLRRDDRWNRWVGALLGRDSYYVENATFVLGLLRYLIQRRPAVVFFSDVHVGNLLWHWRRFTGCRFLLLASNGGPIGPPEFPRFDHVHQVLRVYYDESARAGRAPGTQTLLPYGFRLQPLFHPLEPDGRAALRMRLGLPGDRPVVLSVGAIKSTHKRMDYVVREVAALPSPRPFLVLLGQHEEETPAVLAAADEALGPGGYLCRTVAAGAVRDYYDAADAFVLGSLYEGFGRVLVEAQARGLPCLAADRPFGHEVLGPQGYFADFSRPGALAGLLARVLTEETGPARAVARHAAAYARLSWDRLAARYADMFVEVAAGLGQRAVHHAGISS